jgi:hypothetical protein
MPNGHSIGGDQGFKELVLNSSKESSTMKVAHVSSFQLFIAKFKEILIINIVSIILVSAFLQHLFREPLLARLRNILENN